MRSSSMGPVSAWPGCPFTSVSMCTFTTSGVRGGRGMDLYGYRRQDGRVGIRNHVVILPVDDLSNAAAEGVARLVPGTLSIPHPYGRLQFGRDLELFFRTLIGTGANPNVAAVVVIGIEPAWTRRVSDGIAETGKPVVSYSIEGHGDLTTIQRAAPRSYSRMRRNCGVSGSLSRI